MIESSQARAQPVPETQAQLAPELIQYLRITGVLFVLTLLAILRVFLQGRPLKFAHQWTDPNDIFGDFWHYRALLDQLHTPAFFLANDRFAYPAPCAVVLHWLYHSGAHPHVTYNLWLWAVEAVSALVLVRFLVARSIAPWKAFAVALFMALTSFPWFILYIRGNLEVFVYGFVALGVWAWATGRPRVAAVCWGCAGSFKIYPLLLLALFLRRGRWVAFALGCLTCAAVLWASFWYVGPTVRTAAQGMISGITGFTGNYAVHARRDELWLDHSLLGGAKEILSFPLLHLGQNWQGLNQAYHLLLVLTLPALYLLRFRKLEERNQLCLLLIGMLLLPPVSYDYTLIYMYLVLGLMLDAIMVDPTRRVSVPSFSWLFGCCAVLSCSESWLRPHGFEFNPILKCGALLLMSVILFRVPLRMK